MTGGVLESMFTVQAAVIPGTDLRVLASRLADAVGEYLPVPAAAIIAPAEVPAHVIAAARELAERQGMAEAAADFVLFVARLWHRSDEQAFPADPGRFEVAIAVRTLWEHHVCGPGSGVVNVTVFPVGLFIDAQQWLDLAGRCPWHVCTAGAPDGLIPA